MYLGFYLTLQKISEGVDVSDKELHLEKDLQNNISCYVNKSPDFSGFFIKI